MKSMVPWCLLAFVLGAGAGVFVGVRSGGGASSRPAKVVRPVAVESRPVVRTKDAGASALERALRKRVKELEDLLLVAGKEASAEVAEGARAVPPAERAAPPANPVVGWRERMESMKAENPERYAQMTNRMAAFRMRHLERTNERLALLGNVDTGSWTEDERAAHEKYQDLMARREELMELMRLDNEAVSDEERHRLGGEMREVFSQMRSLEQTERDLLLRTAAANLGLSATDADALADAVKAIYGATSEHGFGLPPGRRGGEGRGSR